MEIKEEYVGLVGHFIAAVLETAGLYAQYEILTNFKPAFKYVGALVYMWSIFGAIIAVALWGSYKKGVYFLVGPAIFWWMLNNTVEVSQALHQFGARANEGSIRKQEMVLKDGAEPGSEKHQLYGEKARVSTFFVKYDRLISSVVQQLVQYIIDTGNNEDLQLVGREVLYRQFARVESNHPDYIKLLGYGLVGYCGEMLRTDFTLAEDRFQAPVIGGAQEEFSEQAAQKALLLQNRERLSKRAIPFPEDLKPYIQDLDPAYDGISVPTCENVWEWVRIASIDEAEAFLKGNKIEELKSQYPDVDWERATNDVLAKLQDTSENAEINRKKAIDIMAAFIFKHTLTRGGIASVATNLPGRGHWDPHLYDALAPVADAETRTERQGIIAFTSMIPYFQGVLLYLLAAGFPFFAFFLLSPNRVEVFFVWMAVWLWAKSWDVGFAFVMFFRDVFWGLMPHLEYRGDASKLDGFEWTADDPTRMITLILKNDPGANIETYYTVVGTLTIAVPFLTAHLCMGATSVFSALRVGIDHSSQQFVSGVRKEVMRRAADDTETVFRDSMEAHSLAYNKLGQARGVNNGTGKRSRYGKMAAGAGVYWSGFAPFNTRQQQKLGAYTGRMMPTYYSAGYSAENFAKSIVNNDSEGRYKDADRMRTHGGAFGGSHKAVDMKQGYGGKENVPEKGSDSGAVEEG